MKDAERDIIFEDFKDRGGEVINGTSSFDKGAGIINLGRTSRSSGDRTNSRGVQTGGSITGLCTGNKDSKAAIILSRTHPQFVAALSKWKFRRYPRRLFDYQVREPGGRTKLPWLR
jgi:N utilization substance protein A